MRKRNSWYSAFRLIAVLLLALALASVSHAASAEPPENSCGTDLVWSLSQDGVLTISGTGDMANYALDNGVTTAPWGSAPSSLVLDSGVTGIGEYAFAGCTLLRSASGDGLQRGGRGAFLGSGLETLVLPGT